MPAALLPGAADEKAEHGRDHEIDRVKAVEKRQRLVGDHRIQQGDCRPRQRKCRGQLQGTGQRVAERRGGTDRGRIDQEDRIRLRINVQCGAHQQIDGGIPVPRDGEEIGETAVFGEGEPQIVFRIFSPVAEIQKHAVIGAALQIVPPQHRDQEQRRRQVWSGTAESAGMAFQQELRGKDGAGPVERNSGGSRRKQHAPIGVRRGRNDRHGKQQREKHPVQAGEGEPEIAAPPGDGRQRQRPGRRKPSEQGGNGQRKAVQPVVDQIRRLVQAEQITGGESAGSADQQCEKQFGQP